MPATAATAVTAATASVVVVVVVVVDDDDDDDLIGIPVRGPKMSNVSGANTCESKVDSWANVASSAVLGNNDGAGACEKMEKTVGGLKAPIKPEKEEDDEDDEDEDEDEDGVKEVVVAEIPLVLRAVGSLRYNSTSTSLPHALARVRRSRVAASAPIFTLLSSVVALVRGAYAAGHWLPRLGHNNAGIHTLKVAAAARHAAASEPSDSDSDENSGCGCG